MANTTSRSSPLLAVDEEVPRRIDRRGLDARPGRVGFIGPAEDDLDPALRVAPGGADLLHAGAVEAEEIDRLAAVLVDGVDRDDDVAILERRNAERKLSCRPTATSMSTTPSSLNVVSSVPSAFEAGDDRPGFLIDGADMA